MSWLSRLFFKPEQGRNAAPSIHVPGTPVSAWAHELFGTQLNDRFDEQEALASSAIWRAIKVLSEPMASMPKGVFERKENGDVVQVFEHPLHSLLNDQPNPMYNAFTWQETQVGHVCIKGNGYNQIIYRNNGDIDGIVMINPQAVSEIKLNDDFSLTYVVDGLGELRGDEMWHFKGFGMNGFLGLNPIEQHRNSFILDRESLEYAKNLYQNGTYPKGVLETDRALSEPAYKRLINSWYKSYSGTKNAGKTPLLEEAVKFKAISLSPIDVDWIKTRGDIDKTVAQIFGIPLHMMQSLDRATNNNIEHQGLEFVLYTMTPWVRRYECEINRKSFRRNGPEKNLFVRYDLAHLLRGDTDSLTKFMREMVDGGLMSRNEVRREYLNKPGVGPEGDQILVQANNMRTLNDVVNGVSTEEE